MEELHQQLRDLKVGQERILNRLNEMNGDMRDMAVEIGGIPGVGRNPARKSLRVRLHELENDKTTASIAATTLDAAKEMRAAAGDKRFTRREKQFGVVIGVAVAFGPYIALFFH